MLPGDQIVVALVHPIKVGDRFVEWPLHVTIVPWFRLDDSSDQSALGLTKALASIQPFVARVSQEAWFGPMKNRKAHLIELPTSLSDIEKLVRNYFHTKGVWLVDETTKKRREFRPHVTVQKSNELHVGDSFNVERLFIVEQKGGYKEVVAEIRLGQTL